MGVDGMSSDETDSSPNGPQEGRKIRRVHKKWISAELTDLYHTIDTYYSSYYLDGRPKPGFKSLPRILDPIRTSSRAPVIGLPVNFYDPLFFRTIKDFERLDLRIADEYLLPTIVSLFLTSSLLMLIFPASG